MTTAQPRRRCLAACFAVLALIVGGCQDGGDLGPSTPTGATDIGGPPVTSTPPPPAGWILKELVPQSQQQAQDTILGYLQRTVDALPAGTVLDATRYAGAGHNSFCDDNDSGPDAPMRFHTLGDLKLPPGVDGAAVVSSVGDIWRSWGWHVFEREGFRKPNQFGYAPDGYRLQIMTAGREGYAPGVQASSPCFPGQIASDDVPFPEVVSAT